MGKRGKARWRGKSRPSRDPLAASFRRPPRPPRPGRGRFRLLFKRLIVILLALALLVGGGAWLGGRLMLQRLVEPLGAGAEARADLLLALPWVNLVYGRNLVIELREQRPITLSLKNFHCSPGRDTGGLRCDLAGLKFERGSGALAAARLSAAGRYDRASGRVELAAGEVDYLVLSAGRAAMTSFTRLNFQRLDFDLQAAWPLLGRSETDWGPLDLFWQLDTALLENFKIGVAFLDGYETAPLNVRLSAHNSAADWALKLDMDTRPGQDLGGGQRRSLSGFLHPPVAPALDFPQLLRFDRLNFSGRGDWAEGGHIRSEGFFLFPRLFSLTITGEAPAVDRERAAEWLAGCFQGRGESDGPRCFSALGFSRFSVDYGDRGLHFLAKPLLTYRQKIFDETDPGGPLGIPSLGLALGLWLEQNRPEDSTGRFDFSSDSPQYPFRREFLQAIPDSGEKAAFGIEE